MWTFWVTFPFSKKSVIWPGNFHSIFTIRNAFSHLVVLSEKPNAFLILFGITSELGGSKVFINDRFYKAFQCLIFRCCKQRDSFLVKNLMLFWYFWGHVAKMTKKVFINDRFYKVFLQKNLVLQKLRNATGISRFSFFDNLLEFDRFYKVFWLPFCVNDQKSTRKRQVL